MCTRARCLLNARPRAPRLPAAPRTVPVTESSKISDSQVVKYIAGRIIAGFAGGLSSTCGCQVTSCWMNLPPRTRILMVCDGLLLLDALMFIPTLRETLAACVSKREHPVSCCVQAARHVAVPQLRVAAVRSILRPAAPLALTAFAAFAAAAARRRSPLSRVADLWPLLRSSSFARGAAAAPLPDARAVVVLSPSNRKQDGRVVQAESEAWLSISHVAVV